ncbi:MAG: hypothetical protein KGI33_05415 [Thaumarchaeota archaeon]|nr:hypothetical protein [Nitrososphaerota archaeon]
MQVPPECPMRGSPPPRPAGSSTWIHTGGDLPGCRASEAGLLPLEV